MHRSCYLRTEWFSENYKDYLLEIVGLDGREMIEVLDVGGRNWNGQLDCFPPNVWNISVLDIQAGDNVDIIPEDPYRWYEIEDNSYDLTMSTNAFQHIDYFWETITEMKRVTRAGGLIYILAPSMRYDGKYPYANWAFNDHGLVALANWANLEIIDHSVAGIPNDNASPEWDYVLDDAVLIARKPGGSIEKKEWAHLSLSRRYKQ